MLWREQIVCLQNLLLTLKELRSLVKNCLGYVFPHTGGHLWGGEAGTSPFACQRVTHVAGTVR